MTLNSALEDLRGTTLKALAGGLQRLEYLAGLHNRDGSYTHWGLARIHGEPAATKALIYEHRTLVSRILATPIKNLVEDLDLCSRCAGMAPAIYLQHLSGLYLFPPDLGTPAERHFNSVLRALSSLAVARSQGATPRAS